MKVAERRRRYPLSDCTNSSIKPTPSSSSCVFNKPVTKCKSHTITTSLPRLKTPPPPVCCSRRRSSYERKNTKKAVANPVVSKTNPNISNIWEKSDVAEGSDLLAAKQLTVPCRKKQCCMSYQQEKSKNAQLQDFIEKQKAYFKEIDEFVLSEEEVETINELE